ncbi:hypothetical protein, partial [Yersinia enterocolitica]|uniref:hypothetical protein n=1 Tax=Yersinia enterocolitica TaxID=630 RepID=UPI001E28370D
MAAIPERYFQEKHLVIGSVHIWRGTSHQGRFYGRLYDSACSLRSGHFVNSLSQLVRLGSYFIYTLLSSSSASSAASSSSGA